MYSIREKPCAVSIQMAAFSKPMPVTRSFGSFDAAAERLHVTPSAISQRIKALEQRLGQVLVRREKPCVTTPADKLDMALLRSGRLSDVCG